MRSSVLAISSWTLRLSCSINFPTLHYSTKARSMLLLRSFLPNFSLSAYFLAASAISLPSIKLRLSAIADFLTAPAQLRSRRLAFWERLLSALLPACSCSCAPAASLESHSCAARCHFYQLLSPLLSPCQRGGKKSIARLLLRQLRFYALPIHRCVCCCIFLAVLAIWLVG